MKFSNVGRFILLTAISLVICAFTVPLANAQAVSGVTGVVTDVNGAVVPGVDVTLTDTKTAKELTTKTNDQGVYLFSSVPPGSGYKLSFKIQGFQTSEVQEVVLGIGKTETHNIQLVAGAVSEVVQVNSSNDVTLNTTDASIGNIIGRQQLQELPIQIRSSPAALIGLQPGVVGNNVGTGSTNRVGSVTGARADQGNITVDGIDANDQATGQAFATVGNAPIDSIEEFRAITTNPSASEGRSSGGQIELSTRSGSNDFHGSLREYNRTAATAANSFFNNKQGVFTASDPLVIAGFANPGDKKAPRPQLTRNQFGGSLGGRIIKDKLFFFFDYEGRRDAQGVTYVRTVPLDHFRNGGLAYINNSAGCNASSRLNTTPGCITILTPAQVASFDPRATGANAALLSFINDRYPHANDFTVGDGINTGGFRFNAPSSRKDNTYTTRIDWNINDSQRLFGRFNIARRDQTDTVNSVAAQFPGDPPGAMIVVRDYSWAVGHNWVVNSKFVNQATVGVSHSGLDFPNDFHPAFPNEFTFGPLTAPFAGIDTQNRNVDTPTIRDDATWTLGNHTVMFGGSIKPIRSVSGIVNDLNFPALGLGGNLTALTSSLRPSNILNSTTARSRYDNAFPFLLGRYASIATNFNYDLNGTALDPGSGKTRDYRYNEYEFYGQDNWKVRSDLTLNLGLRWSYYQPPYEANGFQAIQNIDLQPLFAARVANASAGIAGPTSEPFLTYDLIGPKNNGRDIYKPDWNNFGPRVGFAWNPSFTDGVLGKLFGDRKSVLRGGASVVYDRVGGGITFIQDQVTYLFDSSTTTRFGTASPITSLLNDPRFTSITSLPISNTAPTITRPVTPFVVDGAPDVNQAGQTNYTIDSNFQIPYSYQFSLDYQRELPFNLILDVGYVGRLGKKLFTQADAAQTLNHKDPASGQFLFPAFNALGTGVPQAWFENQVGAAAMANYGTDCPGVGAIFGVPGLTSCSELVNTFFGDTVSIGDVSDTIVGLYANGLLGPNVGVSSQFATNAYITNLGSSNYHGMLVSLQRRFSNGLKFDFNYTWSHSIDNQSSVTNTVFGGLICDLNDLRVCRGNSDFDIRHLINANWIYELPFGHGRMFGKGVNKWVDGVIGGWTISGIYTYRSGLPFSTTTGSFPVSFVFYSPGVPVSGAGSVLSGRIHNVPGSTGDTIQFFADQAATLAAFRNPLAGEIGPRNTLRGPSYWNMDLALSKNFKLPWEGQRIQIRAEAFNAFNHNAFNLPSVNINSGTFGQITSSATAPREMQFAIRWDF